LMECALGTLPKRADMNAFLPRIEGGHLTITYTQSKAATDLLLELEASEDLFAWHSGPDYFQQVSLVDLGAQQQVTVRITSPASNTSAAYLRLKVTRL